MISLHAQTCKQIGTDNPLFNSKLMTGSLDFSQHPRWEEGTNWKSALNNLRLIIQPYIFWCLIEPWLRVFPIPGLKRGFFRLISMMNGFRASPIKSAMAS